MAKTTTIRKSKPFLLCMYVTIMKCDIGTFDEKMVVSLTILTLSALDNASNVSVAVAYLEIVYLVGGEVYRCCGVLI